MTSVYPHGEVNREKRRRLCLTRSHGFGHQVIALGLPSTHFTHPVSTAPGRLADQSASRSAVSPQEHERNEAFRALLSENPFRQKRVKRGLPAQRLPRAFPGGTMRQVSSPPAPRDLGVAHSDVVLAAFAGGTHVEPPPLRRIPLLFPPRRPHRGTTLPLKLRVRRRKK